MDKGRDGFTSSCATGINNETTKMSVEVPFDERECIVWLNGKWVPNKEATVHVLINSAQYGNAVIEGERVYGPEGRVFRLEDHGQRFFYSLEMFGYTIRWTREQIDEATRQIVARNGFQGRRGLYIRRFAYWDAADLRIGAAGCKPIVCIYLCEVHSPLLKESTRQHGVSLHWAFYERGPPTTNPFDTKSAWQFSTSTTVTRAAKLTGWDDALYRDWRGYLADSSISNIFLVRRNSETGETELHTPLADCFLPGITRETIIALALSWGLKVVIGRIRPEALAEPETKEVFLCGTAVEVVPVGKIQALEEGGTDLVFPVEVGKQVAAGYQDLVHKSDTEVKRFMSGMEKKLHELYAEEAEIIERYKSKRVKCCLPAI